MDSRLVVMELREQQGLGDRKREPVVGGGGGGCDRADPCLTAPGDSGTYTCDYIHQTKYTHRAGGCEKLVSLHHWVSCQWGGMTL